MRKIRTLFVRDPENPKRVTADVDPECQWVLDGEGRPTVKYDGTACLVLAQRLYRRHKHDEKRGAPPLGWIHHGLTCGCRSGHGWLPVSRQNPADRWHWEAWDAIDGPGIPDGTYELVGPKIGKHAERRLLEAWDLDPTVHHLLPHGDDLGCLDPPERTHEGFAAFFAENVMEGLVYHHPDGRMAKVKARDFGEKWPR